jgi:hypothetical protein
LVNGTSVGSTYSTYSATTGYQTFTIGTPTLPAGTNTLTLEVTGKDAASTGYDLVIDNFTITPSS